MSLHGPHGSASLPAFSTSDVDRLRARGISAADATRQLELLRHAPPGIVLDRPCTVGDGVVQIADAQIEPLLAVADEVIARGRVSKFVPASGAASRMFKDLIAAVASAERPSTSESCATFFQRVDHFPFSDELRRQAGATSSTVDELRQRAAAASVMDAEGERTVLRTLLETMRYAELPKALIPFHRAQPGAEARTAFEEHLLQGAVYTRGDDGIARMHFTVAPEFRSEFERLLGALAPRIEAEHPGLRLHVTFSEQNPSTDTLAISPDGRPFRDDEGWLIFRPSGHGALLANLEASGGDLVVVSNIDNIVPIESAAEVIRWKRLLIGYLAQLQREACALLAGCDDDQVLTCAVEFAARHFGRRPARVQLDPADLHAFVVDALERPMRVAGVVKNEGEPGGAPFWVVGDGSETSPQIVEQSQVNSNDAEQARIFAAATHFNPADLVCALRSCRDEAFALNDFIDPATVFISKKSHQGRELVALERPGLWNGAMAHWNTVFVEVPAATFAPVKTVLDLLRPQHQPTR